MPRRALSPCLLLALIPLLTGCSKLFYQGADQASTLQVDPEVVSAIETPEGFRAEVWVEGLSYPSALTFAPDGTMYVLESNTIPVPLLEMAIRRIRPGTARGEHEIDELELSGPGAPTGKIAVGLTWHDGALYLSHEQDDATFGISRIDPATGRTEAVVRGLPAQGDHDVNYLVFDDDGNLYFGLGSATNSGLVAAGDPVNGKWLADHPEMHDVPCRDLVLAANGTTFKDEEGAVTGPFQAHGTSGAERVEGEALCSGAVYRLAPGASEPEVIAWGFRNPVAVAVDGDGQLYVGMHGADIRSTRPVLDDPDSILRVEEGAWYGWPDFSAALVPFTDARYQAPAQYRAPGHDGLSFLIDHAASGLEAPDRSWLVAATEPHAALGGMTFVPDSGPFARWAGDLLISEMGDFKPTTDPVKAKQRAGFQVERVAMPGGERTVFARNRGKDSGGRTTDALPASLLDLEDGFERPVDVKFGPDGLLYVLDYGVLDFSKGQKGFPKTGRVFRIEPVR
jgi:glucose/arabinose dehydrogenase